MKTKGFFKLKILNVDLKRYFGYALFKSAKATKGGAKTLGRTTFCIITLSIMTLSITTFSVMTITIVTFNIVIFSKMTLSLKALSISTCSKMTSRVQCYKTFLSVNY
jgi:hypothetical protein